MVFYFQDYHVVFALFVTHCFFIYIYNMILLQDVLFFSVGILSPPLFPIMIICPLNLSKRIDVFHVLMKLEPHKKNVLAMSVKREYIQHSGLKMGKK